MSSTATQFEILGHEMELGVPRRPCVVIGAVQLEVTAADRLFTVTSVVAELLPFNVALSVNRYLMFLDERF